MRTVRKRKTRGSSSETSPAKADKPGMTDNEIEESLGIKEKRQKRNSVSSPATPASSRRKSPATPSSSRKKTPSKAKRSKPRLLGKKFAVTSSEDDKCKWDAMCPLRELQVDAMRRSKKGEMRRCFISKHVPRSVAQHVTEKHRFTIQSHTETDENGKNPTSWKEVAVAGPAADSIVDPICSNPNCPFRFLVPAQENYYVPKFGLFHKYSIREITPAVRKHVEKRHTYYERKRKRLVVDQRTKKEKEVKYTRDWFIRGDVNDNPIMANSWEDDDEAQRS